MNSIAKVVALNVVALVATALILPVAAASADDYSAQLTDLAKTKIKDFAENPVVVAAIVAQNQVTAGYDQPKIDALDKQWRTEVDAADKPLITATMGNDASKYLAKVQEESEGLFTEIFATDNKGLDAAQSSITSDYWQGDEDKFAKTYPVGADAVFLGDVEQDESTQQFQQQVSVTITDPATGKPIGSITAGVNLAQL
jgi:hypothetical protein